MADKTTLTDGLCHCKQKIIGNRKLEPYTAPTSFRINNLEVKEATSYGSHPKLPVYSMKSKKRGVFFSSTSSTSTEIIAVTVRRRTGTTSSHCFAS